jgi:tetratricopeptide (TPR) repeat protein
MQGRILRAPGGALLVALTLAAAAGQMREATVEGQINSGGAVTVELTSQTGDGRHRTYTDTSGAFRFDGIAPGQYDLRVMADTGAVLYRNTVTVRDDTTRLDIDLPGVRQLSRPASAGSVSLADLQHKVPGKAAKEFHKSEELIAKGRIEDAIGRLQNAVSADPAFARAYTNLAACEASLKHFDKAAEYARKAVQLDPGLPAAQMNLGHILLVLREYSGAEAAARATLRLEGESGKARLFLGLALRGEGRLDEALENFTRAADSVPAARLYAADLLARTGNKVGAAGQLRAYLGSPGVENRAAIEHWLTRLAN